MTNSIDHLVILGTGYSPYLAAVFIKHKLAQFAPKITIVDRNETRDNKLICTLSSMRHMHAELKISEPEFVKQTKAEINLAFDYVKFPNQKNRSLYTESEYGFNLNNRRFQFLFGKHFLKNPLAIFENFNINAAMAKDCKFTPPSSKTGSIFSGVDYGYRLTTNAYQSFLSNLAKQSGIRIEQGNNVEAITNKDGGLQSLVVDQDKIIDADLFINTSHQQILLQNRSSKLRAYSVDVTEKQEQLTTTNQYLPYSEIKVENNTLQLSGTLKSNTWEKTISVANNSSSISTTSPDFWLESHPWTKNCIAMGEASHKRASVLVDDFDLLLHSLRTFLDLWPRTGDMAAESFAFNTKSVQMFRSVLELDEFHFALAAGLTDAIPERIFERLESFSYNGASLKIENDWLEDYQWAALFYTLGYRPAHTDTSVANYDEHKLQAELDNIQSTIAKAVSAVPNYETFIKKVHN